MSDASSRSQDRWRPYREAGVDVEAGEQAVERIRPIARAVATPHVIGDLGGFAGLFDLSRVVEAYPDPVLVAGTDGVGTKLLIAEALGDFTGVGIDLVAMCVNDVACAGGTPLFFLDYIATGRLNPSEVETVVRSMGVALAEVHTALLGGEMAEMPGVYAPGRMDLAGFAVGVASRASLWGPHRTQPGDVLLGLPSSGLHSNGFSLVRAVLARTGHTLSEPVAAYGGLPLGRVLLTPTRLYVGALQAARGDDRVGEGPVHAAAHITGGGFPGNVPRILPPGTVADIDLASWEPPAVFTLLGRWGALTATALLATFNMGIGCVLAVDPSGAPQVVERLRAAGETPVTLGRVAAGSPGAPPSVRFAGLQEAARRWGVEAS